MSPHPSDHSNETAVLVFAGRQELFPNPHLMAALIQSVLVAGGGITPYGEGIHRW